MEDRALRRTLRTSLRTSAEVACAVTGLFFCVATSQERPAPEPDPEAWEGSTGWGETDGEDDAELLAALFVHNGTQRQQVVRLRTLAPGVDIDCDVIGEDPGRLITDPLLGEVDAWSLDPDANLPLDDLFVSTSSCAVMTVGVDGLADALLLWRPGERSPVWIPARGEPEARGGVFLREGPDGLEVTDGGAGLLHARFVDAEVEARCTGTPDADRLAWAEPVPIGLHTIERVSEGLDGCFELALLPDAETPIPPWYVCVPAELFAFVDGDRVEITQPWADGGRGIGIASVVQGDPRSLHVGFGETSVLLDALSASWIPSEGCGVAVEPHCGTVVQAGAVQVVASDGTRVARPGEWIELAAPDGGALRLFTAVAQDRAALAPECAQGPDVLGLDVQIAVAHMGLSQGEP